MEAKENRLGRVQYAPGVPGSAAAGSGAAGHKRNVTAMPGLGPIGPQQLPPLPGLKPVAIGAAVYRRVHALDDMLAKLQAYEADGSVDRNDAASIRESLRRLESKDALQADDFSDRLNLVLTGALKTMYARPLLGQAVPEKQLDAIRHLHDRASGVTPHESKSQPMRLSQDARDKLAADYVSKALDDLGPLEGDPGAAAQQIRELCASRRAWDGKHAKSVADGAVRYYEGHDETMARLIGELGLPFETTQPLSNLLVAEGLLDPMPGHALNPGLLDAAEHAPYAGTSDAFKDARKSAVDALQDLARLRHGPDESGTGALFRSAQKVVRGFEFGAADAQGRTKTWLDEFVVPNMLEGSRMVAVGKSIVPARFVRSAEEWHGNDAALARFTTAQGQLGVRIPSATFPSECRESIIRHLRSEKSRLIKCTHDIGIGAVKLDKDHFRLQAKMKKQVERLEKLLAPGSEIDVTGKLKNRARKMLNNGVFENHLGDLKRALQLLAGDDAGFFGIHGAAKAGPRESKSSS